MPALHTTALCVAGTLCALLAACSSAEHPDPAREAGPVELVKTAQIDGNRLHAYRYVAPPGTGPALVPHGRGYVLPATDGLYVAEGTAASLRSPLFVPFDRPLDPLRVGLPTAAVRYNEGLLIAFERALFYVGPGGQGLEHLLSYDSLASHPERNITNLLVMYVDAEPYVVLTGTSSIRELHLDDVFTHPIQELWGTSVVLFDLTRREVVVETEPNRISFDSESPCSNDPQWECNTFIVGHDFEPDEVCRIVRANGGLTLDCVMQDGESTMDLEVMAFNHPAVATTLAAYDAVPNPDAIYVVSAAVGTLFLGEWDLLSGTLNYRYMHRAPDRSFSQTFHWGSEIVDDYVITSTGGYGTEANRVLGIQRFTEVTVYEALESCVQQYTHNGRPKYADIDCLAPVERIDVWSEHGLRGILHLGETSQGTLLVSTAHLSNYTEWFDHLAPVSGDGIERYVMDERGVANTAPAWWDPTDEDSPVLFYLFADL